jgi:regulatory protein
MVTEQDRGRVYNAAIRLLARREYGIREITKKLCQRHPPQLVEEVVTQLLEQSLISDSRFAESLCNSRTGRGYGPIYIAQELSMKGISKEIIEEFIDKNDPLWLERAMKAGRKKASPVLLEKNFMYSEAFEEEFLRQKGGEEFLDNVDEGFDEHQLNRGGNQDRCDNGEYDDVNEFDLTENDEEETSGKHPQGSSKFKTLQKAKKFQKNSSANSRQKRPKMVNKFVYKKTKEQLFRERRQKEWMKVANFLSRRGFPGDMIAKAMNNIAPD